MRARKTFRPSGLKVVLSRLVFGLLVVLGGLGLYAFAQEPAGENTAVVLKLDGVVGPAIADYLIRGLDSAAERNARLAVIEMNTPGGLDSSMRDIVSAILSSRVPVATYVTPSGARAASAGTYILYASHVAAMAPSTHLGAATPVELGGGGGLPFGQEPDEEDEALAEEQEGLSASEAKAINDAIAYIRGLAELRDRNAEWAESAVREAATLTAGAAAEENVIDFTATDIDDLFAQADGMTVQLGQAELTLETTNLIVERIDPDLRTELLSVITNPNVALILMMIGIYGLIFEFMNPGTFVPGTIGGISLVLGLYALAVLPVTYAGIGLLILGAALILAEAFAPSFGILGIGGAVAFALGAALLFDIDDPGMGISWPMIAGIAATSVTLSMLVAYLAYTAHRGQVVSGRKHMIGAPAEVLEWNDNDGYVLAFGERWKAVADGRLAVGQKAVVTDISGLTLTVQPDGGRN